MPTLETENQASEPAPQMTQPRGTRKPGIKAVPQKSENAPKKPAKPQAEGN